MLSSPVIRPIAGSTSIDYPKSLNQEKTPYLRNSASMKRSCEPLIKANYIAGHCISIATIFFFPSHHEFYLLFLYLSIFLLCHFDFISRPFLLSISFILYLSSLLTSCTTLVVILFQCICISLPFLLFTVFLFLSYKVFEVHCILTILSDSLSTSFILFLFFQ